MRVLLDTHVLFWALTDETLLSPAARSAIRDGTNEVFASIATAWEIAIKVGAGKWSEAEPLIRDFEREVSTPGFGILPINVAHVCAAGLMRSTHRDPFDRLLAAQSMIEGLSLVTADPKLAALGAPVLW